MKLHEHQQKFVDSDAQVTILFGSGGSGKTTACNRVWMKHLCRVYTLQKPVHLQPCGRVYVPESGWDAFKSVIHWRIGPVVCIDEIDKMDWSGRLGEAFETLKDSQLFLTATKMTPWLEALLDKFDDVRRITAKSPDKFLSKEYFERLKLKEIRHSLRSETVFGQAVRAGKTERQMVELTLHRESQSYLLICKPNSESSRIVVSDYGDSFPVSVTDGEMDIIPIQTSHVPSASIYHYDPYKPE